MGDSEQKLRILHVNLLPPGPGGIERLLVSFLRQFDHSRFDVNLAVLGQANEMVETLRSEGYPIWTLDRSQDRFDWGLFGRLTRLLRELKPDLIHVHGTAPLLFAAPAAWRAGRIPVVYTCHFSKPNVSFRRRILFRQALRGVLQAVGVSNAARGVLTDYFGFPAEQAMVIHNGVDLERFEIKNVKPIERTSGLQIGFCGLLRPEKELPTLVKAFETVRAAIPDARLILVGDGPERARCEQLAVELGVADSVLFAGQQSDVRPFLAAMDVLVLPSREEAMPVALLEAMAMGRACVASAVGGIVEVIDDGANGVLVPPRDPHRLATELIRLGTNTALRERLGTAARAHIEQHFSVSQMMQKYADLYLTLSGREPSGESRSIEEDEACLSNT